MKRTVTLSILLIVILLPLLHVSSVLSVSIVVNKVPENIHHGGTEVPEANANVNSQIAIDQALLSEINKIKAIDNHAHPLRVVSDGEIDDLEDYAGPPQSFDIPIGLRPDNRKYLLASKALFGNAGDDMSAAALLAAKQQVIREQGDAFPTWVLDRLGIEVMLTNRVAMGRGLKPPRFLWVPFADPLMYPLDNSGMGSNPDYVARFKGAERMLATYMKDSAVQLLPATLDEYLSKVVTETITRQKRQGAVALKFATAYHRTLNFASVTQSDARAVYARYRRSGVPPPSEYKALPDFIFRHIAREAGRLGLVVHIHVGGGASGYFNQSGANPFVLEPVLNDPTLRKTKFVLIHGGLPFAQETRLLIYKPNVYTDFSGQTFLLSTRELSTVLRSWLEFVPEKILFGTDAFEVSPPEINWADLGWVT
ncbi:MAG: amidohydrolase family protein, partial [Pyrinomonadaceae bacterium]